ncbi:MAG: glycosyltransferase, partial [Bdellovibrionota bacterium]
MTIKIVRIIDRVNVGGPAIHVALTSRGLSAKETDKKFDTLLVHGRVAEGEEEMGHLFDSSIRREIVPSLSRKISPVSDLLAFLSIIRILLREKPEVVHTHKSKAGVLGRLAAWLLRVPVQVHTFHGQVFEGYFSPTVSEWIVRTERFFANRADAIIAISPALREEISAKHQIAPLEKVRLVS